MVKTDSFSRNNFDLLRILAASQVMVAHSFHHLGLDTESAWFQWLDRFPGVPVFFIISGFLVSASLERSKSPAEYFTNRFLRIFPALWCCLGISVLAAKCFGNVDFSRWETLPWLLGQISFVQFFNPEFLRGYGTGVLNGSLWTITVELQFYLLLPLLYAVLLRKSKNDQVLGALLVLFFLLSALLWTLDIPRHTEKWLQVTFLPHFSLFLLGIWMRRRALHESPLLKGKALIWLIVYASLVSAPVPDVFRLPLSRLVLGLLTISSAYTLPGLADNILQRQDLSYGVYIYHMVAVNAIVELQQTRTLSDFWMVAAATYSLAAMSWWLVEKPYLRKKTGTLKVPVVT